MAVAFYLELCLVYQFSYNSTGFYLATRLYFCFALSLYENTKVLRLTVVIFFQSAWQVLAGAWAPDRSRPRLSLPRSQTSLSRWKSLALRARLCLRPKKEAVPLPKDLISDQNLKMPCVAGLSLEVASRAIWLLVSIPFFRFWNICHNVA